MALMWQPGGRQVSDEADMDEDVDDSDGGGARVLMGADDCGHDSERKGAQCVAEAMASSTVHAWQPDGGRRQGLRGGADLTLGATALRRCPSDVKLMVD